MSKRELSYPFLMRHLTDEEGGGFLIEYPDLPGCISDGETIAQTIENGEDAVRCWLTAAKESGRKVPKPGEDCQSGKWVQRVPKSLHTRLATRAKMEGISLNTLVVSMISAGLGQRYEIPNDNSVFKSSNTKMKSGFRSRAVAARRKAKSTALKTGRPIGKKSPVKHKKAS